MDALAPAEPGALMLRLQVLALGDRGTRASLEAVVSRRCDARVGRCDLGSHVQSWRTLHRGLP
jgi:hypothetical protein